MKASEELEESIR